MLDETKPFVNRDVLSMIGLFDVTEPLTITVPTLQSRYLSLMAINELGEIPLVLYRSGEFKFEIKDIGTRYMLLVINIAVDPSQTMDIKQVRAIQDSIQVSPSSQSPYPEKTYDAEHFAMLWEKLNDPFDADCYDSKGSPAAIEHLVCQVNQFGGLPRPHLITWQLEVAETPLQITLPATMPVTQFWSLSAYNDRGLLQKNAQDIYSYTSLNSKTNPNGNVTIHLESCERAGLPNCLPTAPEWLLQLRMYQPTSEALDGRWPLPDLMPSTVTGP